MIIEDTICAPSTPPIASAISVIRVSGPESKKIIDSIFDHAERITPRYAVYGSIIDSNHIIDDVIVIYYQSPKSFTGEDMAEIFCHGNPLIVNSIIKLLNRHNVRLAEPGEFSKRAFLNGKLDLTEAEAINHIINARSNWEIDAALGQMHGSLKNTISAIRENLILLKADIECGIDFIEEDIEFVSYNDAEKRLDSIGLMLEDVLRRCAMGEVIHHGIDVPIVGKPNVGKSSILNLILNSERAIVSDIPGTTRDLIKEMIQFAGVHINLYDTAGIDIPGSELEKKGIELSHKKIETGSIIIMALDAATGILDTDRTIIDKIKDKQRIFLLNKIDLVPRDNIKDIEDIIGESVIAFSAKTGEGLNLLEEKISDMLRSNFIELKNSFISDIRINGLLQSSIEAINKLKDLFRQKEQPEIIAFELQSIHDILSGITGEISPDDILNSIFSRFCIGK